MAGNTLDTFLPNVQTQDTRKRLQVHPELVAFLKDPESSLYCEEMDRLVDALSAWINSSNFKISLNGLEIVALLIDRMGDNFKHHVPTVLSAVVDRLGDNKDQVREASQEVLIKIMSASSPQYVFDRMAGSFTHKLWHVREETLILLQATLNHYGAKTISLSKLVPQICKMLEDQSIPVREQVVNTLVEIYRHVGERVRHDILKREINQAKLNIIMSRMDEIRDTGKMIAPAESSSAHSSKDDTDFARPTGVPKTSKRASSVTTTSRRSATSKTQSGGSGTSAGACDEDLFMRSFEDVPKLRVFSSRELTDHLNKIRETLSDPNKDWEKRVESLKEVRSVIIAGALDYDFLSQLRSLETCFITSCKDLRSQVVREACISAAYMSQTLQNKFDHFAEALLPSLIALIPNSAKVMATAGTVAIRFLIQYTHAPRLIPILTGQLSSKSAVLRRECTEFLDQLLHTWATHTLERHIAILQESIRKGIADPDTDARAHSRKAFWGFAEHFKEQADSLLNSLEPTRQKQLQGELSNSSSNNSLNSGGPSRPSRVSSAGSASASAAAAAAKAKNRSRSMSTERSNEIFRRPSLTGTARRSVVPKGTSPKTEKTDANGRPLMRSSSAVDLADRNSHTPRTPASAPRIPQNNYSSLRKKARSSGNLTRLSLSFDENTLRQGGAGASSHTRRLPTPEKRLSRSTIDLSSSESRSRIPRLRTPSFTAADTRPKKSPISGSSTASSILSPERSRPRARIGVSQSQPSSRSGSPSSRLSYITHTTPSAVPRTRRKSGIPRSQGASRETSPSRLYGRERKLSGSGVRQLGQAQRPPHANKPAVLSPGSDMESAFAEALKRLPGRKRFESYESDDAGSETSSVCSERSYGSSFGRTSELTMKDGEKPPNLFPNFEQDVSDILNNLSSPSWADRKEGLVALQNILRGTRVLNRLELKKISEIFTRMFHDPHGKVFSMFLETLIDFVAVYKLELSDWLYVLVTRLLNKMGADMLGSVYGKVQRCLEAVRDSFPFDLQFATITKFIIDQTQTPNLKVKVMIKSLPLGSDLVKVALLNYLHGLTLLMDPSDFVNTSDTRLAVSRIITWTTEPKSVDVRKTQLKSPIQKAAQAVLIALFNLNTPEFSMMLTHLPKTFQDGATKILHNHLRSSSNQESEPLSPRNVTSPTTTPGQRYRASPNRSALDELETENMNPEEIYNSIKKTSADIQNLSKLDGHYDDPKKGRDCTSQDSGIQSSMPDVRGESPDTKGNTDSTDSPRTNHRRQQQQQQQQYNPSYYQDDNLNGYNRAALAEAVFDVENELFNEAPWKNLLGLPNKPELPSDESDIIAEILTELSNHNERQEERKNAMLQLIKMTREGTLGVWDEHFKTILLLLLETLGDNDPHIRALSLRVLREILKYQPNRFKDYAELTILKILEAHKDPIKEVTRAAEECASTLASSINHEQCVRVLIPIIQTAEYPINLAAIKMQSKVMEIIPREVLDKLLSDIIPGLLTGYDNTESSVRKASVFCLVAIYLVMGEDLRPYLKELNGSKMKLLNLYIKRALSQKGEASSTSTSHTSSPQNVYDQV